LTYDETVEKSYFFGKTRVYVSQYTLFGYFSAEAGDNVPEVSLTLNA